jgi:hypothetical protein
MLQWYAFASVVNWLHAAKISFRFSEKVKAAVLNFIVSLFSLDSVYSFSWMSRLIYSRQRFLFIFKLQKWGLRFIIASWRQSDAKWTIFIFSLISHATHESRNRYWKIFVCFFIVVTWREKVNSPQLPLVLMVQTSPFALLLSTLLILLTPLNSIDMQ